MALVSLRNVLRGGKYLSESVIFNHRTVALSNTCASPEQKSESQPPVQEPKVNEEVEKLAKEITDLKEKNNEILDKYKRSLADSENLRTRLQKQIQEARIFGIQSFCKDLLDVADVLNKATETVPKEAVSSTNPHLKSLYEGLVMTEAQLQSVFKRHGLEKVNPVDEKFDPNFHEALFQQEVAGKEPGTVVIVSKIGYKLKDRVIRPALVGVSK